MKLAYLLIVIISFGSSANTLELERFKEHQVPKGKQWVVKDVKPSDCKVCTSDLRIDGGLFIGNSKQLTIYGNIELSFNSKEHGTLTLLSGTKFWLGDIRSSLLVTEIDE